MAEELLEIRPQELKFVFEVRKQSSCSIQLGNKTDQYVAFKVKTTSPKKYCVRPNIGIIKPNGASDFTVTMQAPQVAPPVLQCRDKFLIQGTIVPFGTSEEDITVDMFDKESGKYIEERKIKVVLASPVESPSLLPVSGEWKQDSLSETTIPKYVSPAGVENVSSPLRDPGGLDVSEDFKELQSKLSLVDSKLKEAELTISRLTEERSLRNRERDALKREVEMLRKTGGRAIQVGFPFLYVCMVALVAFAVGYIVQP
ncbi:vesicle-associated protein 2-2-like [Rhodamnia argentea]|uniref:Vesicle-associated protein 2-2-like n=1 Tax=Rhodamnia argentea TaxID=178133 RepID=A0A8B8QM30_9MYRT|nr:vesicle-associated protein 2-2-like [Rhodamnia argentea]XP_048130085.1 vesicle-associated protein 2-2-like [Rhodamnia argentea]